jgi:hypothetical protein
MDMKEFNATAIRTETTEELTLDVRPFGEKQGEAIDSYLHDLAQSVQYGVASSQSKPWVLIYDPSAVIPQSTQGWLKNLAASGRVIEMRSVDRQTE